jgi:hypothetical protein
MASGKVVQLNRGIASGRKERLMLANGRKVDQEDYGLKGLRKFTARIVTATLVETSRSGRQIRSGISVSSEAVIVDGDRYSRSIGQLQGLRVEGADIQLSYRIGERCDRTDRRQRVGAHELVGVRGG